MSDLDPIDALLQPVLTLPETEWSDAVEQLCARHAVHAAEIRRRFALLGSLGFAVEGAVPSRHFAVPERLGEFQLRERLGQGVLLASTMLGTVPSKVTARSRSACAASAPNLRLSAVIVRTLASEP